MAPSPPPFASSDYWDTRFHSNPNAFDWLQPASILDVPLAAALLDCRIQKPEILHIGCGTSLLSYHLRAHVDRPEQIHNLDFSKEAIELGKRREREIFGVMDWEGEGKSKAESKSNDTSIGNEDFIESAIHAKTSVDVGERDNRAPSSSLSPSGSSSQTNSNSSEMDPKTFMQWDTADLLSLSSILSVCKPASYSLIVEKSCSDSIACAEDIFVSVPFSLTFSSPSLPPPPPNPLTPFPIHPLHVLALNLALITLPGGRWIALSYSSSRFPFLSPSSPSDSEDSEDAIPDELLAHGFPDPAQLWTLERKEAVEAPPEGGMETVHRPKVSHWLYVLLRTEKELCMRRGGVGVIIG